MTQSSHSHLLSPVSRRGFLAAGGAGVVGLPFREALARQSSGQGTVVQIVLTGGASHLETFDPKPHAPREVRGPLHSIATSVPGVRFSECLPRLAGRAHQLVVLRSLSHQAAPIHETGLQLLSTGQLASGGCRPPHIGIIAQHLLKQRGRAPVAGQIGGAIQATGTLAYHGDEAGILAREGDLNILTDLLSEGSSGKKSPASFEKAPRRDQERYGSHRFGKLLWSAARQVERGVRFISVNTFDRLEGEITWDAHACPQTAPATVFDYRDILGPQFDQALAACLDDLQQSGLLKQTLIICTGEMGRSPRLNEAGGRDHWTQVWSGLLAGGGLAGGQVIGETDEHGEASLDAPLELAQLPGLALEFLGIAPGTEIVLRDGQCLRTPNSLPQLG